MLGMGIWSQRWLYYVSFLITMSQLPTRTAFVKQLRGGRGGGRAGPWLEGHNIAARANTVRRVVWEMGEGAAGGWRRELSGTQQTPSCSISAHTLAFDTCSNVWLTGPCSAGWLEGTTRSIHVPLTASIFWVLRLVHSLILLFIQSQTHSQTRR